MYLEEGIFLIMSSYGLDGASNLIPGSQGGTTASVGLVKPGKNATKNSEQTQTPFKISEVGICF